MQFDTFIAQAWDDHVRDPHGVADRLPTAEALVADEPQFIRLADITHHLYGDHLNDRGAGLAAIDRLTRHARYCADGASGAAVRRFVASLHLSDGDAGVLDAFGPSDRIRVVALAISNLTDADPPRAIALFHEVRRLVDVHGLPATDPMHGDVAQMAHNMAAGIERDPDASTADLAQMMLAARTARHHWRVAGDPSDVFAGEYRLASAWRRSGDLASARVAAAACVALAEGDEAGGVGRPQRRFLAGHLAALVARASGDVAGFEQARANALAAHAQLGAADQARQTAKRAQLSDA